MVVSSSETISNKNLELSDEQKNRSGKKKRKVRKKKCDSHINNHNGKVDHEAVSLEERKEGETEKTTSKDQVQLPIDSREEPGVTLLAIDPISSTKEDSLPDANRNGSKRKRKRKKDALYEDKMLDDADKTTNEAQVHPPKNALSNSTIQEDSCQLAQDSCEKPRAAQLLIHPILSDAMTCSKRKRQRKKDKDTSALRESGVDTNSEVSKCDASHDSEAQGSKLMSIKEKDDASAVIVACLKSKDDTMEEQNGANVKANDTESQTQNPKAKKKKRSKTKTMEVCDPVENSSATSMKPACVSDVTTKKRKGKKKKTADMEACDPSGITLLATAEKGSVECLLDHSNKEASENCDRNAGKESVGEGRKSKTKKSAMGEIQAQGINDVGRKRKKRNRDKMEKCESVATVDSNSEQCLLYHSKRGVENCDGISDGKTAVKDLVSKIEDSATEGKSLQITKKHKKDKEGEVDQDGSAEAVGKVEVKSNKRKSKSKKKKACEDHKTDNMDEENNDVSVPRNEEEIEFERELLETSSVLIQNSVVEGVASLETEDLPRCSCEGGSTRKLVVFDLNGILADIVQGYTGQFVPDGKISSRSVFRRPFVASFLDFCFEGFDVGIWSSRRIGLDYMNQIVLGNHARNLLFCYDQNICITTNFKTQENSTKPLFLKDLRRVWNRFGTCLACGKQKYDEKNTLLVDDSPHKALCNPPNTGIFPFPYQYTNRNDSALGPDGELRKYLERLVDAENVQKFVEENPIGQTAITETHESWNFYSRVIEAHK